MTDQTPIDLAPPPSFDVTPAANWPVKTTLRDYQQWALSRSVNWAAHFFAFDPGGGKTLTVLAEAGHMYLSGEIDTLIVVAPPGVHRQWVVDALPEHASFPWRGYVHRAPMRQKDRALFDKVIAGSKVKPFLRVFCFNYEALLTKDGRACLERIFATSTPARVGEPLRRKVYLAIDEIQRAKNHKAQRTKALLDLRPRCLVRRGLSGTPILKGLEDLWAEFACLDPEIIGQKNFYGFRSYYCKLAPVPGNPRASRIVGYRNRRELQSKIEPHTSRVRKSDMGDLPEKIITPRRVEMSKEQARAYSEMEGTFLTRLSNGEFVTASTALVQLNKLLQLANGFVFDAEGEAHWRFDTKIDALAEDLEEYPPEEHILLWAHFVPVVERLAEKFPQAIVYRQQQDVARFRETGGLMIINPARGSAGLDMPFCQRAMNVTHSDNYEHRAQSLDRIHRLSSKGPTVWYRDYLTEGTVEAKVHKRLAAKENLSVATIDRLREVLL